VKSNFRGNSVVHYNSERKRQDYTGHPTVCVCGGGELNCGLMNFFISGLIGTKPLSSEQ
jgi:hypothetical protein